MARIVVCGYMVRHPMAGNVLAYFNYLLGLHRLGHEVAYLEESGWPRSCYDPGARDYGDDPGPGMRAVEALLKAHGMRIPLVFVERASGRTFGADREQLKSMLGTADLLLNVGGVCWLGEFELCGRRALIDMDPMFTQIGRFAGDRVRDHHVHFSYGTNIGRPGCSIPLAGVEWHPLVPPVVPELWHTENDGQRSEAAFTTIANWSAYGSVSHAGEHYGQKDEEFMRVLDLPTRVTAQFELALSGAGPEIGRRFREAGWLVRDAGEVSNRMDDYRRYIVGSRGEFSVAKHAYVKSRSGWFSDRSVCYLAAGLPVVLQDTGVGDSLPTGLGLVTFSSVDEAVRRLEDVLARYEEHRAAARRLVETHCSHRVVLPRVVEIALSAAGDRSSKERSS